nr:hypothetical protein [Bradyrhizobium pachyrhizi]
MYDALEIRTFSSVTAGVNPNVGVLGSTSTPTCKVLLVKNNPRDSNDPRSSQRQAADPHNDQYATFVGRMNVILNDNLHAKSCMIEHNDKQ